MGVIDKGLLEHYRLILFPSSVLSPRSEEPNSYEVHNKLVKESWGHIQPLPQDIFPRFPVYS